ncbi:MAG TPA: signal peptidase I [Haloplasmataceae bacterium]
MNDNEARDGFKIYDTKEKVEVEVKKPKKSFLREVLNYLLIIVLAFALAQIVHRYLFTPVTVVGPSMMTGIRDKDKIFLSRLGKIERFDVIVFEYEHSEDPLIKRVIGLPGDYIRMENYKIYLNGNDEPLNEYYLDPNPIYTGLEYAKNNGVIVSFTLEDICNNTENKVSCNINGEIKIPEGYYLVLGDNRNNSLDSRRIGLISKKQVLGEAKFILYPFDRFGKTFR